MTRIISSNCHSVRQRRALREATVFSSSRVVNDDMNASSNPSSLGPREGSSFDDKKVLTGSKLVNSF